MAVDLHTHSCCSDGSLTPSELMELAYEKKLSAIALTDHDTVSGIKEAKKAAERNEKMLRLISENVCNIDKDEFYARFDRSVITRAHFAQYLYEKGIVSSVKEAFDRYLGDGKPCYIPKEGVTAKEAITCIREAGGHPVLAHPPQYRLSLTVLDKVIKDLKACGLEGIEVVYSTYTNAQERELRTLAVKNELHMTGGSDYHGTPKPDIQLGTGLGNLYVPDALANWLLA